MASTTPINAQTIILKVNDMLKNMLEDYYDTIVNDVLSVINKEIDTPESNIEHLKKCILDSGLKNKIFNIDKEESVPLKIATVINQSIPAESVVRSLKRKNIQALCKVHGIPGRQKNEELIQQLMDKRRQQIIDGKQPDNEPEVVKEIEEDTPEIKVTKVKKTITKKPKKIIQQEPIELNKFVTENIDEDEDDMTLANMMQSKCNVNDEEEEEIEEINTVIMNEEVVDFKEDEEKIFGDNYMEEEDDEERDLAEAYDGDEWDNKFFESDDEEEMQAEEYNEDE